MLSVIPPYAALQSEFEITCGGDDGDAVEDDGDNDNDDSVDDGDGDNDCIQIWISPV